MSHVKRFVAASLATLSLSALHAEPRWPGNVAGLTLRRIKDDLIVVRVLINRTGPYDFLVDTGSQITTFDTVLASDLHLRIEGTTGVSGVATQSRSAFAFLDLIEVGSHSVPQSLAVIQDIVEIKAADPGIRGILGGTSFRTSICSSITASKFSALMRRAPLRRRSRANISGSSSLTVRETICPSRGP